MTRDPARDHPPQAFEPDLQHLTAEALNLLAEGATSSEIAAARTHVTSCVGCNARLRMLEQLMARAHNAPRTLELPVDIWPAIRTQIEREESTGPDRIRPVPVGGADQITKSRRSRRPFQIPLAAAAVALLGVSIAGAFVWNLRTLPGGPSTTVSATASVSNAGPMAAMPSGIPVTDSEPDISDIQNAPPTSRPAVMARVLDQQTDQTEQDLLAELEMRRHDIRPDAAAEIEANLEVVDSAIGELREAIARDPNNAVLRQLLASSYERKAALLQQTRNAS